MTRTTTEEAKRVGDAIGVDWDWPVDQRSTLARRVSELPRFGIKGVVGKVHQIWIDEVTVFFFDRNQ
jgi:hypothetical protein